MSDSQSNSPQLVVAQGHSQMLNHALFSSTGFPDTEASLPSVSACETCSLLLCAAAGGLMILNNNFAVSSLQLEGNSAFYGGAMFLSADLSTNATISNLTFADNLAEEGQTQCMLQHMPYRGGQGHHP